MQENTDKSFIDSIPDEEPFHQAITQIEAFGKRIFQIAERQRDSLLSEKERHARETLLLHKRLDERENELEALRKTSIDSRMELAEACRNANSLKLEVKQLKEQLTVYHVDAHRIEEAEKQLRTLREENSRLHTRIEELNNEASKRARDHKTEIDTLTLRYEQEKVALHESIQIAEERARNAAETAARIKSLSGMAEREKDMTLEELARSKREQKQQLEKLRNDLFRSEAAASEQERRCTDQQREYERKLSLVQMQAAQQSQAQLEALKSELADKERELGRARYQIEQINEDHRRALETMKQDMNKQLDLRAEEIRRHFILKSAEKAEQLPQ